MQKARIRTSWRNKGKEVSPEELGVAMAAVVWRVALNAAKNLHEQNFNYRNDTQRLGVMREYIGFLVHATDRQLYSVCEDPTRKRVVISLAQECERHFVNNVEQIKKESVEELFVGSELMDFINQRASDYAKTKFNDRQPGYETLRILGSHIQQIMGEDQTNKWVIDQIMDIDGPEAFEIAQKSFTKLLRSAEL